MPEAASLGSRPGGLLGGLGGVRRQTWVRAEEQRPDPWELGCELHHASFLLRGKGLIR